MVFRSTLLFSLILLSVSVLVIAADDLNCVYTFKVQTGDKELAGTDSKISIGLSTVSGDEFHIENLTAWGGLKDHDYFERGNLDILSGRGPCFGSLLCRLNLTSDGTGPYPGWFVDYVDFILLKHEAHSNCQPQTFAIGQWLAIDKSPYSLTVVRDNCPNHDVSNHVNNQTLLARPV